MENAGVVVSCVPSWQVAAGARCENQRLRLPKSPRRARGVLKVPVVDLRLDGVLNAPVGPGRAGKKVGLNHV